MACPKFERTDMLVYLGVVLKFHPEIFAKTEVGKIETSAVLTKMLDKIISTNYPNEGKGIISAFIADPDGQVLSDFSVLWQEARSALVDMTKLTVGREFRFGMGQLLDMSLELFADYVAEKPVEISVTTITDTKSQEPVEEVPANESIEDGGVVEDSENTESPGTTNDDIPVAGSPKPSLLIDSKDSTTGIDSIVKNMLGPERMHLYDELINYFHKRVSDGWIQQEVDENGNVIGFVSVNYSSRNIIATIHSEVSSYFSSLSNGEIMEVTNDGKTSTKLIYFNKERLPKGVVLEQEGPGFQIFSHMSIREGELSSTGTQKKTKFITGNSMEEAITGLKAINKSEVVITKENVEYTAGDDHLDTDFKDVSKFTPEIKEIFFGRIISQNAEIFFKNFYPQLAKGYKERFRTGFVNNAAGVAASDAQSAATKMHQATTQRLIFEGFDSNKNPILKQDVTRPYLTPNDFDQIYSIIQKQSFSKDRVNLEKELLEFITKNRSTEAGQILASIYFRFFSPFDYKVGEKVYRSYASIAVRNRYQNLSMNDYIKGSISKESVELETNNHLLEQSLSGIISALSSATGHESIQSVNHKSRTTNSVSYGNLPTFRDEFASPYMAVKRGLTVYTKPELINNPEDKNSGMTVHPTSDGKFEIIIKNSLGSDLKYSITPSRITNGKPSDGFPYKIEILHEPLSSSDLKKVFAQFSLPNSILSDSFANEFNSNLNILKEESQRKNTLEKFLLTNVLIMEMNQEHSNLIDPNSQKFLKTGVSTTALTYDPVGSMWGYEDILKTTLGSLYGVDNRIYSKDHEGNRIANVSVRNKVADSAGLAMRQGSDPDKINSIHRGSPIVGKNPLYKIMNYFSKTGIKVGDKIRSNQEMTILEQSKFQIEEAYLQHAETSNFEKILLQFGVMSDRTDIPMVEFQKERIKDGKSENGFLPVSNRKLDRKTLLTQTLDSQETYWANVANTTKLEWKTALGKAGVVLTFKPGITFDTASIYDVATAINNAKIPYNLISENTELVKNVMLTNVGNTARIPLPTLQNIKLFSNRTLAESFMKLNLSSFKSQLKKEGYVDVSPSTLKILKNRFDFDSADQALDILLDSFFYDSNLLGNALLRLHTGGYVQFNHGKRQSIFEVYDNEEIQINDISTIGPDGSEVIQLGIISQANNIPVEINGVKTTLGNVSLTNILETNNPEWIYYKSVLENKSIGTSETNKKIIAHALFFDDVMKVQSNQFIDQIKRNAGMGSTHQSPRLVSANEAGMYLGQHSKNITILDPKDELMRIIGKSGFQKVDKFDAVQIGHPLYFLRLYRSLGGDESGYAPNGAPVKDITNEVDANGFYRFQKKATFDIFSNEILKGKATPELYSILTRMNTAVKFEIPSMMVYKMDPLTLKPVAGDFSTVVTRDMWLSNGESLNYVLDTTTNLVVNIKQELSQLKAKLAAARLVEEGATEAELLAEFESRFASRRYKTDKVLQSFENLQQLWEYYGSIDNDQAWTMVAETIGYQSGNASRIDLSDATYPNRDSYVEKVGFKTQEKTGSKQLLSARAVSDPNILFDKAWSKVDNTYHGVILQASHNPDTTSSEGSFFGDTDSENEIPMITQVLSACIGEGNTLSLASDAYDAVGTASVAFIANLDEELHKGASELLTKEGIVVDKKSTDYAKALSTVIAEHIRKLTAEGLSSRSASGIIGELVGPQLSDSLSYNLKQVLPLVVSMLNSRFNKNTVRMKFPGGQYIVSPSDGMINTYSLTDVEPLIPNHEVGTSNSGSVEHRFFLGDKYSKNLNEVRVTENIEQGEYSIHEGDLSKLSREERISMFKHQDSILPQNAKIVNRGKSSFDGIRHRLNLAKHGWTVSTNQEHNQGFKSTDVNEISKFVEQNNLGPLLQNTTSETLEGGILPGEYYVKGISLVRNSKKQALPTESNVLVSGLNRADLNKILYDKKANPRVFEALENNPKYDWKPVDLTNLLPSDIVKIDILNPTYKEFFDKAGITSEDITIKVSELKRLYKSIFPGSAEWKFNDFLVDTCKYRLGNMKTDRETLQWNRYYKYDEDGTRMEIKDSPAYIAFQQVDLIADNKTLKEPLSIELIKMYYFDEGPGRFRIELNHGINPEYLKENWTPADEITFNGWLSTEPLAEDITELYIRRKMFEDPYFRKKLEKKLFDELESEGWENEPAEFYMPPMHGKRFLIKNGDSLFDIIGSKMPDFNKLLSLGILKTGTYTDGKDSISFKTKEDIRRYLNRHHNGLHNAKYKSKLDSILRNGGYYDAMTDQQRITYNEVMHDKTTQYNKSVVYFRSRLDETYGAIFDKIENSPSLRDASKKIKSEMDNTTSDSELYKALAKYKVIIDRGIVKIEATKDSEKPFTIRDVFAELHDQTIRATFYDERSHKMASGFPTTLEFITARIPAQGMQSFTAAKIKNFVFSTKNSCYGPLEMLKMTGADYDIDKQNMMTWAVTMDGEIIDWEPFLDDNGKMSHDKYKKWVKTSGLSQHEAQEVFKSANQNYIVHKIISIIKSPVNAIQANTPVSLDKATNAIKDLDYSKALTASSLTDLMELREHASPFNPHSMFKYERLNMDGKSGIGIFASDLKAYFAAYYATISSTEAESNQTVFRSNSGLDDDTMVKEGINPEAIQYFNLKTGKKEAESTAIANTTKFTSTNSNKELHLDKSREFKAKLAEKTADDTAGQFEILSNYIESVGIIGDINVNEQAWEDLSELLSAATDNAKELILGKINATANTSSIISTMIRMGIDLKYALELVGHSDPVRPVTVTIGVTSYSVSTVRELISLLEKADDTQTDITGSNRLLSVLKKIQPQLIGLSTKDYLANPFRQLYTFAAMTEEFGLLASLLSINQGIKNNAYDSWKFRTSLEIRMTDILQNAQKGFKFNLKSFINGLANRGLEDNQDDIKHADDVIKLFNQARVGINVPFIISKNKHYFGYYQAMFKSIDMVQSVSDIDRITEELLNKSTSADTKRYMDLPKYKALQDFIYSIGVEKYMQDVVKIVTLNGLQFDLTIPSQPFTAEDTIGGRLEFINYLPKAVKDEANKGKENYFLDSLPVQNVSEDFVTKISLPILKGPDLNNISSERFSRLQMGLAKLETDNPSLHNALFQYSLITTKGGYAGGSFMGLYSPAFYADYSAYIKKESPTIKSIALNSSTWNTIQYNNTVFLKHVTTDIKFKSLYDKDRDDATYEDLPDLHDISEESVYDDFADDMDEFSTNTHRMTFRDVQAELFDTTGITDGKLNGKIKEDMVVSKETGIVYKWDNTKTMWIPLVQYLPKGIIPYTVVNTRGDLSDTGFEKGWKFQLNETDAYGNAKFGYIISYVNKSFTDRLGKNVIMSNGLKLTTEDIIPGQDNYLVQVDGDYRFMTKHQILDDTKTNIDLYKGRIVVNSTINKDNEVINVNMAFFRNTVTGEIYAKKPPLTIDSEKSKWSNFRPSRVANASKIVGEIEKSTMLEIFKPKNGIDPYPTSYYNLDKEFSKMKEDYLNTIFKEAFPGISDYQDMVLYGSRVHQRTRDRLHRDASSLFRPDLHIIDKMNMLYERDKIFERFDNPEKTTLPIPKEMPKVIKTTLKDEASLQNLKWDSLEKVFKHMGVPKSDFNMLVTKNLLKKEGKFDLFIGADGNHVVFKKGREPKFYSNTPQSKKLSLPETVRQDFNKEASPEILTKVAAALNKRFPNSTFTVLTTKDIELQYGSQYAKSNVKAFVINGEVVINSDRATLDTPMHEFTHIYMQHLKVDDPDLYLKIVNDALQHPLAKHIKKSYPDLGKYELGEEIFVSLVGSVVSDKALENSALSRIIKNTSSGLNLFSKIKNFFKSIFGEMFGTNMDDFDLSMSDSLNTIIEKLGNNVAYGKKSILSGISNSTKSAIQNARRGSDLDYKAAKQFLMDRGFIKIVCT